MNSFGLQDAELVTHCFQTNYLHYIIYLNHLY